LVEEDGALQKNPLIK